MKNLVKIARVVPEISSRTHRHTHTHSSQYFATAPAGEVIKFVLSAQVPAQNNAISVNALCNQSHFLQYYGLRGSGRPAAQC